MEKLVKNQIVQLNITDIGIHGEGIGKIAGFPLFVKNALPGDRVKVVVTKVKASYAYAKMTELMTPSPDRVAARCPVAEQCGGCQIQSLDYQKQLAFKHDLVRQRLIRIGGFDPEFVDQIMEPIRGMKEPWRYRNKAQYPVSVNADGKVVAGFYAGRTHHLIENTDCLLEPEINSRILETVLDYVNQKGIAPYNEEDGTGILRHIMIRHGFATGETLLCLVVRKYKKQVWAGLTDVLQGAGLMEDGIVSVGFSEQPAKNNVIMGNNFISLYGGPHLTDKIGNVNYIISPQSFYQVNTSQMKVLYDLVAECAGLTGQETVWDLYCGIGTIGLYLADRAKRIIGVEVVPEAVKNARENARINQIENAVFYEGTAEKVFEQILDQEKDLICGCSSNQVVIVDPPRKGCDAALLKTISEFRPERIVYVSCDAATLARDLKTLCENDYQIERVVPVDQFCHSVHVETVVLLRGEKVDGHIRVDLDIEELEDKPGISL